MNRKTYCSAEGDAYRIPDYLIVLGQVVAAVFPEDGNWHRCVITALTIGKYVEVCTHYLPCFLQTHGKSVIVSDVISFVVITKTI